MSRVARLRSLSTLATLWLLAAPAPAQPRAEPLVALGFEGDWPAELARDVRADLEIRLLERGIRLGDAAAEEARAAAAVYLSAPDSDRVRVRIFDFVNDKRVEPGDLALGRQPRDVWPALIGTYVEEKLRAAWMEILLEDAPPPRREPPASVRSSVERSIARRPPSPQTEVRFAVETDVYTGGGVLIGGSVSVAHFVHERFGLELGAYASGLAPVTSTQGVIDAVSVGGDAAVRVPLFDDVVRLELFLAARVGAVLWRASPFAGSGAAEAAELLLTLRGGLRALVFADRALSVGLSLGVGGPIVASVAHDEQGPAVGLSDVSFGFGLDLGWWP